MFETEWDLESAMQGLGERWRLTELSHKPYPSGRATHGDVSLGEAELQQRHGRDQQCSWCNLGEDDSVPSVVPGVD